MAKETAPRKHRRTRHYTFMIISTDSDRTTHKYHLGYAATQILAFSIFAILVAIICAGTFITVRYHHLKTENKSLQADMSTISAEMSSISSENASLSSQNEELQATVDQVSKALNIMVEDEEANTAAATEAALPKGFPLSSQASYDVRYDDPSTDSKDNAKSGNYILVFKASNGSSVVSAGDGTVLTVTSDAKYGKCVTIDHGNGYVSIYRYSGSSLVKEGDTVSRGDALFLVSDKDTVLGYQIQYNDAYINPEDMIEISG